MGRRSGGIELPAEDRAVRTTRRAGRTGVRGSASCRHRAAGGPTWSGARAGSTPHHQDQRSFIDSWTKMEEWSSAKECCNTSVMGAFLHPGTGIFSMRKRMSPVGAQGAGTQSSGISNHTPRVFSCVWSSGQNGGCTCRISRQASQPTLSSVPTSAISYTGAHCAHRCTLRAHCAHCAHCQRTSKSHFRNAFSVFLLHSVELLGCIVRL